MFIKLLTIFVLTLSLRNANSARILAYIPTASYSHQMFFEQIWRELAIRGHDMVVVTTDPTGEKLPNFKEVSVKESYPESRAMMDVFINENIFKLIIQNKMNDMAISLADHQFSLPQIQEILNNKTEHFDLVMVEHLSPIICGLKQRFKCPMIGLTSLDAFPASHRAMGNPVHSALYPMPFFVNEESLSFTQRFISVFFGNLMEYLTSLYRYKFDALTKKHFGPDTPGLIELIDETDMLFVNANPLFSAIRPHTPSTISIAGGIHMKPEKPLPNDLKIFMDNANEGVVYFSLGSNVKSKNLTEETRQTIMETFSQLPYQVLWKFEDDTLPGKPNNVKITKWAPQQDVLRHKNIKVFITQGGIQSLEEALYSHVPVVTIPFFGDQQANAERVKSKGLGLLLDRHNLNLDNFKTAILEVIENPKYKNNVKLLATRIQDEPMKPLEKAVWWTEYVLRHGGAKHLKGPRIPTYQYYYVDVIGLLSLIVVLFVGLIYGLIKLIVKILKKLFVSKKIENKIKKS